jgi:hypothetical protein
MLRQGPVPAAVHGLVEYVVGVLFIAAPFLFDFDASAAKATSIVVGLLVLVMAATTEGPTGLIKELPVAAHAVVDYALAAGLVAAPFLFRFSDDTPATGFFITLGVLHLLLSIATRFVRTDVAADPAGGAAVSRRS